MRIERPWARVKIPAQIPDPVTAEALQQFDEAEFTELLRDQLLPRDQQGEGRARWDQMWQLLDEDDDLADRALEVLDGFVDRLEEAKAGGLGVVDDAEIKRINRFAVAVNAGVGRLQRQDRPLAWAGAGANAFNGPARKVIARLVEAIAEHRHQVRADGAGGDVDEQLWAVLGREGLDPDLGERRPRP